MNLKITTAVIVLVTVLLLAQSVSVVEAHHKSKDKGDIRKSAETKSKSYDKQGNLNKSPVCRISRWVQYNAQFISIS